MALSDSLALFLARGRCLTGMVTPQPYTVKARDHPFATDAARGAGQNGRDLRRRLSTTGRRSRVSMTRRSGRGHLGIRVPRTDGGIMRIWLALPPWIVMRSSALLIFVTYGAACH